MIEQDVIINTIGSGQPGYAPWPSVDPALLPGVHDR